MKVLPNRYIIIFVIALTSSFAIANPLGRCEVRGCDQESDNTQSQLTFEHIQLATHGDLQGVLNDYLVSEKLDGVRGFWDGKQMFSRSGRAIAIPNWFTKDFPIYPLDGELWMGRGAFEQMSALARRKVPIDELWRKVKFMVFDLPASSERFEQRYAQAELELSGTSPFIEVLIQRRFKTQAQLELWFQQILDKGGEGLMLHRKTAIYSAGRSQDLIKLKPYYDAEATVIAYQAGKGKLEGMMGALLVENEQGVKFKVGTGFTMKERVNPPPLGSRITYQYSGLTQKGTPRFARFLRVRFKQ